MAYADLTAEQKTVLDGWMSMLRSWTSQQGKLNNEADAIDTGYNANVSAILADLGDTDSIPNATGLIGAASLTKSEVVSIVAHVQGVLTNYNTSGHRELWAKACGSMNLVR